MHEKRTRITSGQLISPAQRPSTNTNRGFAIRYRIRTIKPELWESEDFMALPIIGQIAFFCLISHADDAGRLRTNPEHLAKAWLHIPVEDVAIGMTAMERQRMIQCYTVDGCAYVQINGWLAHQKIDHPTASLHPSPPRAKSRETARDRARPREHPVPTVSDRIGPEGTGPEDVASSNEDARTARLKELRSQVCQLWATHHGWPDGKWPVDRRDDAQLITVWVRDRGYPLQFWEEAIAQVPKDAKFRWLTTPPDKAHVCRLEEWAIAYKDRAYAAEKAREASTPPVVAVSLRRVPAA